MYADDLYLVYRGCNADELRRMAARDLLKIENWAQSSKVTVNASKTKFMTFGDFGPGVDLSLGAVNLERVSEFRYLGVTLDSSLNFESHLNQLLGKLSALTGAMRRTSGGEATLGMRMTIYHGLFVSIMSYAALVWSSANAE